MRSVLYFSAMIFSFALSFVLINPSFASVQTEEVVFANENIENLPPVEEMVGIPDTIVASEDLPPPNREIRGEQIQLAHGATCQRTYGQSYSCDNQFSYIHALPPVYPSPPAAVGNVCRSGFSYCYTYYPAYVGTSCTCYGLWGFVWFYGVVTVY